MLKTEPLPLHAPLPSFLDLEASSLDLRESYPTEVAWSLEDGRIDSTLIRPEQDWLEWDSKAEQMTGISRALLEQTGLPPVDVADALNRALAGRTVYCDGGMHDQFWLKRLFQAANRPCRFLLQDISTLLYPTIGRIERWPDVLQGLARQARETAGPAHRADRDVAFLMNLYALVQQELGNRS